MTSTPSAEEVGAVLDAEGVVVFSVEGHQLLVSDAWPSREPTVREMVRIPVGFGVAGLVARNGLAVTLPSDSPRNPAHRRLLGLRSGETVSRMCLPAPGVADVVAGVLAVHRRPPREFGPDDLAAATPYAARIGLRLHADQLWSMVHRHRTERDRLIEAAISAQEAERRRIAFDLHDGVTTALASMSFHLSAADLSVSMLAASAGDTDADAAARARSEVAAARRLADLAYQQTRVAISGLHSLVLDDLGLVAAFESLVQMTESGGARIDLIVEPGDTFGDLTDHAGAALYRIAQEALSNAVKHAKADRIVLSLRRVGDSVILGCTDDGVGFDPEQRRANRLSDHDAQQHFGLSSIAERCALIEGSLRLESMPGRGTTLLVELPLSGPT